MIALLFSDSHGNIHNMKNAIENNKNVQMIIHLGDCVSDILKIQQIYTNMHFEFVKGNNDWHGDYETEKCLEIEGKKIFLAHGHSYGVKNSLQKIIAKGIEIGSDAVFFGHTHQTEESFSNKMLLLNPGSVGAAYLTNGKPTYCLLEITREKINVKFKGFV
jgi:uncharacterized protein